MSCKPILFDRHFSTAVRRRLERLESEANQNPGDPIAQHNFLLQVGKTHPEIVVQRVESGRFAGNEGVFKEYVKALVGTNRFDNATAAEILQPLRGHNIMTTLQTAGAGTGTTSSTPVAAAAGKYDSNYALYTTKYYCVLRYVFGTYIVSYLYVILIHILILYTRHCKNIRK